MTDFALDSAARRFDDTCRYRNDDTGFLRPRHERSCEQVTRTLLDAAREAKDFRFTK
jgi:hypothetical protein